MTALIEATDTEAAVGLLARLVAYDSTSHLSNLDISADLAQRLEDLGGRILELRDASDEKSTIFASFGPDGDGGLVLSAHTDVVPPGEGWSGDPFTLREEDGRLYARGACDMKGYVAAVLTALPAFIATGRPVHVSLTYDEETGCLGAQQLCAHLAAHGPRPGLVWIGEPTGLRVVDAHKGCFEYTTRITGRDGHGSDPSRGANAVEMAAALASRLVATRLALAEAAAESPFDPPQTTINIGRLIGGQAHNVIAAEARLDWEMRPVRPEDARRVHADFARTVDELLDAARRVAPEAAIETETIGEVAGLARLADNPLRDHLLALTGDAAARTVPFGTEAGLFQALGAHTVVCGPGHIAQAHRPDEYIDIAQIGRCIGLLHGLAGRMARESCT